MTQIRWRQVDDAPQGRLFGGDDDEVFERRPGEGQFAGLEFLHVRARRIINEVPAASHMPFRFTINAYRGCSHACTYCFARPTHEYLGLDAGEDFERRIVVKINAVERLRAELRSRTWHGDHIAMGTNTDPYQRCEGKYRLTRGVIEELGRAGNPFSILTKSTLVLRDLDVLVAAAERTDVRVSLSIGTLDEEAWRLSEPGTPHPLRRIEAVRKLTEAGIPCGVLVAPVLPGLSDGPGQVEAVVRACVEAGAVSVSSILLHLRPGVREQYLGWLRRTRPDLVSLYERSYPRSYAPKADQAALAERVRAALTEARSGRRRPGPRAVSPGALRQPVDADELDRGMEDVTGHEMARRRRRGGGGRHGATGTEPDVRTRSGPHAEAGPRTEPGSETTRAREAANGPASPDAVQQELGF